VGGFLGGGLLGEIGLRPEATTGICCEYMSGNAHAVLEQAKKLTAEERIELARELLASVDDDEETGTPEEIEAAWDDEIRRRDEQVVAGGGGTHDAEDVLAEAEHIIRSPR
jgi:hypothetical protein